MTTLKPCPFCRGHAELAVWRRYRHIRTGELQFAITIACTDCPAEMTVCRADVPDITADQVVLAWNGGTSTALQGAAESAVEALLNVPCVGEVYDQQHSDTHMQAMLDLKSALEGDKA